MSVARNLLSALSPCRPAMHRVVGMQARMITYFSEEHDWIDYKDGVATYGITQHAANELGEITFVELPCDETYVDKGDTMGAVESVKAAVDLVSPISGTIKSVNEELQNSPALVGEDPEGDGWIIKIDVKDKSELDKLMNVQEYQEFVRSED